MPAQQSLRLILAILYASGTTQPRRRPHYGRPFKTESQTQVGCHYTRLRVQDGALRQFHRQLDLHLNSSSSSSQLTNKHNLNLNPPIQDKHFHRLTHQTYYICITRICTSRQYTQTHTSTASHHTSWLPVCITANYMHSIPRNTRLTPYSELAQRLREEQPRALQRPLRVRDHLRVPRASAEGPRVEAHLRRLRHLVRGPPKS
jgi:hypothetical protein